MCVCVYMRIMGVSGLKKVGELKKDNRKKKKLLLGDREKTTERQRHTETERQKDRDTQKQRDRKTETHRNRESGR